MSNTNDTSLQPVAMIVVLLACLFSLALTFAACTSTEYIEIPVLAVHDTEAHCSSESSGVTTSSGTSESSSATSPAIECPVVADGDVEFCLPEASVCRFVRFSNVAAASGAGPLVTYWHGTYESIPSVTTYNPVTDLQSMVASQAGVLALPYPDMMAAADGEPFPWWYVCGAAGLGCDRADDFELARAIVTCALEQGLADPDRVGEAGMSAGGIQASARIADDERVAGFVVWSGGVPPADRPTVPAGPSDVFVLHGGPSDTYCGAGAPPGCHSFVEPNEELAADVDATITCNHGYGHTASLGPQGAEFLAQSRLSVAHPWAGFPVGAGGWASWPSMSAGTSWVLRNDCDPFGGAP